MNFTNVWKTSTPETTSASHLRVQEQNIPLFGIVRTMNRRRPEPIKMPRRPSADLNDNDYYQIPLPYNGPGNFTTHALAAPSSPIATFLDSTFRTYTERIHTELTNLRTVCTKVVFREQQEKEKWKAHCVAFRHERDIARERVKVLIGEKGGHMVNDDGSAARQSLRELRRSRSYGPLPVVRQRSSLKKGSRSASPPTTNSRKKNASASLDVPAASLRSSSQSSRSASPALSSSATAFSELDNDTTLHDLAYPSPKLTPLNRVAPPSLFLPSNAKPPPLKRSHSAGPILAHPLTPGSSATETAEPLLLPSSRSSTKEVRSMEHRKRRPLSTGSIPAPETTDAPSTSTKEHTLSPQPSWVPTRDALLKRIPAARKATLQIEHVDLMFRSADGLFECRACRLAHDKLDTGSGLDSGSGSDSGWSAPVTSFSAHASWEDLLDHCLMTHPTESRDVAGLHPAQMFELRRRLREKDSAVAA